MAESDVRDEREQDEDELEEQDEEQDEQEDGRDGHGGGLVDSLMSQLGEHKEVLKPVATTVGAAAATYAARKLPDLIEHIENGGGDKLREKLEDAKGSGGVKGFAAGAASRAFSGGGGGSLLQRLTKGGEEEAERKARDAGGVKGLMAKTGDKLGNSSEGGHGWGKGRRLPLIASIDVGAPLETVYDQWTQFEEMGTFMHRVESISQEEDEKLTWNENVWGRRRRWEAKIVEQVPNERIKWELEGGGEGTGVIQFHELAPRLTRVEVVFDWQPSGIVEKLGSGLRFHKRAAKADLKRFKAFVEVRGEESGAWRGRIEDGQVKRKTRNRRNKEADPVPEGARQHSEAEQDESRSEDDGNDGGDEQERESARAERKQRREQRQKQRS